MTFDEEMVLAAKVAKRYYNSEINVIALDNCPKAEHLIEIYELDTDISQGTGNVIIRYEYDPEKDILYRYADF